MVGMRTTPACQRRTASPHHRWALLCQQHTRGEGKHLPIIACRGEPAQALAGPWQLGREPEQPAKRRAPHAFSGVRACVRALGGELAGMGEGK